MKPLESLVLLAMMRNREFYTRYASILTKEFFRDEAEPIHYALTHYWKERGENGNRPASVSGLKVLAKSRTSPKSWPVVENLLDRISRLEVEQPPAVEKRLQQFLIRQGLSNLALSISKEVDGLKDIDPKKVQIDLNRLMSIQHAAEDHGVSYCDAGFSYFNELEKNRVPTGIRRIDEAIGGGLGTGELGILVAPYGGGKTALLVNLGASALRSGLSILHITLEIHRPMVVMRYDMCLGNVTTEQLREHPRLAQKARRLVNETKGSLIILDRSHEHYTPLSLEKHIEENGGTRRLDLILVDYADLMRSDRGMEGGRFEFGEVYRELRRVAAKFSVPIWTASQANREAARQGEFDGTYIAEDITKCNTADAILCAVQTEEQRQAKQMILKVDKTRMSDKKPSVTVGVNYSTMSLFEVQEGGLDIGVFEDEKQDTRKKRKHRGLRP